MHKIYDRPKIDYISRVSINILPKNINKHIAFEVIVCFASKYTHRSGHHQTYIKIFDKIKIDAIETVQCQRPTTLSPQVRALGPRGNTV